VDELRKENMTKFCIALFRVNVWKVRVVALSFLVLMIGSGSQVLVNAMAAGTESEATIPKPVHVILKTPIVLPTSTLHLHIRRAGVDSPGGYAAIGER